MVTNLDPVVIDRHPIMALLHLIVGAMPLGDVASGNAVLRPHALEPSANVKRDVEACLVCLKGFSSLIRTVMWPRPTAKPIVVETVSPTRFIATICGLPSVGDLLSSIDQVPLLCDVLEAFGGVALKANRPSKHLSRRGSFEIALHDFTLRELLRVEAQSIQFS
jgi:hypothetical protein